MDAITQQLQNLSLNIITSSRKKKNGEDSYLLIDDDFYEYKVAYEAQSGKITCRCNSGEFPNCVGSVSTIGHKGPKNVVNKHEHNNTVKTKVKIIQSDMRAMAAFQPDCKPHEVAAVLPSYNASRQLCSRKRVNPYDKYEIPDDIDFVLHDDFKVSEKGELFLIYDEKYNVDDRMLIFSTEKYLQILSENNYWLCDGLFDAAPDIFTQFEKIACVPKSVSCDFEAGIINSIEDIFPEADIADRGLATKYNDLSLEENLVQNYIGDKKRTKMPSRKDPRFDHTENEYVKLCTGQVNKRKLLYIKLEVQIDLVFHNIKTRHHSVLNTEDVFISDFHQIQLKGLLKKLPIK
ncbi:hypothetical protein BpHYR1_016144 [Brachionus plicatilis]|uniref:FLYWCH-type domain-containing protein n=1 Tax=Brachionus plicatilis TaxID=10195 RepID=A0A3M7RPY8_BRAPC|nr:hypothetical protein BpHYR1_016144 [Brachionus plicatilis]